MARRKIDSVFEECLTALLEGRLSIEGCKALYPDMAQELDPLLRTAIDLSSAYQVDPSPDFTQRARLHFLQARASRRMRRQPVARHSGQALRLRSGQAWGPWRWASTALGAALALALLTVVSTTLLRGGDGELLPSISVVVAQTERARANLETLESALRQGQPPHPAVIHELQVATSQLAATLAEADSIDPEEKALVVQVASKQQTLLTEVRGRLPEEALGEADQALADSEKILVLVGITPTPTSTPTPAASPSPTPTSTPTPAASPSPTLTPSPTPSP